MNQKRIIDNVEPNRRSFVMHILGGAAFVAPMIATFSMDNLTAQVQLPLHCNISEGYVGPNEFQAFLSGPGTRANGVATFIITTPPNEPLLCVTDVTYSLQLTKGASAANGVIVFEGANIVNLPVGTPAAIKGTVNLVGLCDLDELLVDLRSGKATMNLQVLVHGEEFVLSGPITPAVNSFIIKLIPAC